MIYLVEDDDNIRKLVCYALNHDNLTAEGFCSPSSFWQALKEETPELVMLDIMLPEEDGLSILKKLRSSPETEDIPVIMLTAKGSEYDKVTGLDMGADDYITKPFGMTELISRVRALLRRCKKLDSKGSTLTAGVLCMDIKKHTVTVNGEEISLSYKEYMLLSVLLKANGEIVTRDTLLCSVWGEFYGESRTLDVHIRKLRVKLKEAGSYIKTVKNIGYKIEVEK